MKFIRIFLAITLFQIAAVQAKSQVTSIPQQAKESFFKQYPDATNVKWENDLINVNVKFEQDSSKMNAEYNNKGIWKSTLKEFSYDQLPEDVKDGFKKSKYADRELVEVKMLYLPGYVIQYRLKTVKSDVEKKYLFFNTNGKLVRSAVTL